MMTRREALAWAGAAAAAARWHLTFAASGYPASRYAGAHHSRIQRTPPLFEACG
jgi:hypothetical protein